MKNQLIERTCANCCAYEEGECMNLVSFSFYGGQFQPPKPDDSCPNHKTLDEDRKEGEAISRFRSAIGLPPRNPVG